jgi:Flp pilus assembly protein TadD
MSQMRLFAALSLVVPLLACGGGESKPPETGGTNPPPTLPPSLAGSSTPAATTSSPAPEPPPSAEVDQGLKLADAGKFAEARAQFEAAVKKNGNNYLALTNLGLVCEKLGDKACAESAYKNALTARPDYEAASAALSSMYIDGNRFDEALTVARAGLAKHAQSAPLHENTAIALAGRGDKEGARGEFQQAIQLSPTDPMLHVTFAHFINMWGEKGAAAHLDAAMQSAKSDVGLLTSIGDEYRLASMFTECVATFDKAVAVKDGGEVRTERAICKRALKDEAGALADLKAAVQKEPSYAPAHYHLGGRYASNKQFKEAAAEYEQYLKLEPKGSLADAATKNLEMAKKLAAGGGAGGGATAPKKK